MRLLALLLCSLGWLQVGLRRRCAACGALAVDRPQAPQSKSRRCPTIRVETRLVNVALNVVDAKGSPVGGLERDDFEILEDGKAQKIAIFEKEARLRCRLCWRSMRARVCCGMSGWRRMQRSTLCGR